MASLNNPNYEISRENDSIVITKPLATIPGGVTLDTEGYTDPAIKAGQVIVHDPAKKTYKPLKATKGKYEEVAEGEVVAGIVVATVPAAKPFVSVLTMGQVNAAALPVPVTAGIKEALPGIDFLYFKEAEEQDI